MSGSSENVDLSDTSAGKKVESGTPGVYIGGPSARPTTGAAAHPSGRVRSLTMRHTPRRKLYRATLRGLGVAILTAGCGDNASTNAPIASIEGFEERIEDLRAGSHIPAIT